MDPRFENISKLQSGLRKNCNAQHSLIIRNKKRGMSVDGGGQAVALLTDLSKTRFINTNLVSISYISFICICANKNNKLDQKQRFSLVYLRGIRTNAF